MSDEPIKFRCYRCGKLLGAPSRRVGAVVSCPRCRAEIQVPEPGSIVPDPAPESGPSAVEAAVDEPVSVSADAGADVPFPAAFLAPEDPVDPIIPAIQYESPTIGDASPSVPRAPDVVLPPGVVLAWSLLVLAAIPLAFVAGLLIGRFLWK